MLAPVSEAAVIVQELFDGMGLDVSINGQGDSGSSVGLSGTWVQNAGGTAISTASNFNVQPLPGLPPQTVGLGGLWMGADGNWSTGIWATRPMASVIDFGVDSTLYFSVRINNTGDVAGGFGFASGSAANSEFVGVGGHWDNHTDIGVRFVAECGDRELEWSYEFSDLVELTYIEYVVKCKDLRDLVNAEEVSVNLTRISRRIKSGEVI